MRSATPNNIILQTIRDARRTLDDLRAHLAQEAGASARSDAAELVSQAADLEDTLKARNYRWSRLA